MASSSFITGLNGAYSYGGLTGVLPAALAANSEVFQFRWTDTTRKAIVQRVKISAAVSTTFFAAGVPVQIDLVKSTAWSGQGTGGTGVTLGTGNKIISSYPSSLVAAGDIRIATTAALGAGTKTLQSNSLRALAAAGPITASLDGTIIPPGTILYESRSEDFPIVLSSNEGLSIRSVAVPITGTWTLSVIIDWMEGSTLY